MEFSPPTTRISRGNPKFEFPIGILLLAERTPSNGQGPIMLCLPSYVSKADLGVDQEAQWKF